MADESKQAGGALVVSDMVGVISLADSAHGGGPRGARIMLPDVAVTMIPPKRRWNAEKGHWEKWEKGQGGKWDAAKCDAPAGYINSTGTQLLGGLADLTVSLPDRIWIEGRERENPCVIRHEGSGIPSSVSARVAVSGRGFLGTSHTVEVLVTLQVDLIYRQMLAKLAATRDEKDAGAVTLAAKPTEATPGKVWCDLGNGIGYLCTLAHPAVGALLAEFLATCGTVERKAVTVATRNATQKHPALVSGRYATWEPDAMCWTANLIVWDPAITAGSTAPVRERHIETAEVQDLDEARDGNEIPSAELPPPDPEQDMPAQEQTREAVPADAARTNPRLAKTMPGKE